MTQTTITIDRNPKSLSITATELDVEQFRTRLEDEISRAFPSREIRVVTGDVLGFECSDPEIDRAASRIWLSTAAEVAEAA